MFKNMDYMVNQQKLDGMLRNLESALVQLREIAKLDRKALIGNGVVLGGAKYYLQIAIESCINIGNHIISSENFRSPKDYRDIFTVLSEQGIIPENFAITLRQMTGLRNRLVHLYWEVDDELLYSYMQNNLGDFDQFVRYILAFVNQNS
jgi:uncharacterized protein YutE (UPF0331/DUF86 family)